MSPRLPGMQTPRPARAGTHAGKQERTCKTGREAGARAHRGRSAAASGKARRYEGQRWPSYRRGLAGWRPPKAQRGGNAAREAGQTRHAARACARPWRRSACAHAGRGSGRHQGRRDAQQRHCPRRHIAAVFVGGAPTTGKKQKRNGPLVPCRRTPRRRRTGTWCRGTNSAACTWTRRSCVRPLTSSTSTRRARWCATRLCVSHASGASVPLRLLRHAICPCPRACAGFAHGEPAHARTGAA